VEFAALCKKLAISAKRYQVTIALESLQSSETNFLNTLKSAAKVVRLVNHPNFRLNADIFHMMREGESAQSIIDAADVLAYCEVAEKETRSFPGVKDDDFKPYFRALKKAKFKGKIFIEGSTKNPSKDVPLAYTYLTNQLKEVYSEK
jgi:sugar phosphate isomerase/epimerase